MKDNSFHHCFRKTDLNDNNTNTPNFNESKLKNNRLRLKNNDQKVKNQIKIDDENEILGANEKPISNERPSRRGENQSVGYFQINDKSQPNSKRNDDYQHNSNIQSESDVFSQFSKELPKVSISDKINRSSSISPLNYTDMQRVDLKPTLTKTPIEECKNNLLFDATAIQLRSESLNVTMRSFFGKTVYLIPLIFFLSFISRTGLIFLGFMLGTVIYYLSLLKSAILNDEITPCPTCIQKAKNDLDVYLYIHFGTVPFFLCTLFTQFSLLLFISENFKFNLRLFYLKTIFESLQMNLKLQLFQKLQQVILIPNINMTIGQFLLTFVNIIGGIMAIFVIGFCFSWRISLFGLILIPLGFWSFATIVKDNKLTHTFAIKDNKKPNQKFTSQQVIVYKILPKIGEFYHLKTTKMYLKNGLIFGIAMSISILVIPTFFRIGVFFFSLGQNTQLQFFVCNYTMFFGLYFLRNRAKFFQYWESFKSSKTELWKGFNEFKNDYEKINFEKSKKSLIKSKKDGKENLNEEIKKNNSQIIKISDDKLELEKKITKTTETDNNKISFLTEKAVNHKKNSKNAAIKNLGTNKIVNNEVKNHKKNAISYSSQKNLQSPQLNIENSKSDKKIEFPSNSKIVSFLKPSIKTISKLGLNTVINTQTTINAAELNKVNKNIINSVFKKAPINEKKPKLKRRKKPDFYDFDNFEKIKNTPFINNFLLKPNKFQFAKKWFQIQDDLHEINVFGKTNKMGLPTLFITKIGPISNEQNQRENHTNQIPLKNYKKQIQKTSNETATNKRSPKTVPNDNTQSIKMALFHSKFNQAINSTIENQLSVDPNTNTLIIGLNKTNQGIFMDYFVQVLRKEQKIEPQTFVTKYCLKIEKNSTQDNAFQVNSIYSDFDLTQDKLNKTCVYVILTSHEIKISSHDKNSNGLSEKDKLKKNVVIESLPKTHQTEFDDVQIKQQNGLKMSPDKKQKHENTKLVDIKNKNDTTRQIISTKDTIFEICFLNKVYEIDVEKNNGLKAAKHPNDNMLRIFCAASSLTNFEKIYIWENGIVSEIEND